MELKVYADRLSQPARAILIFCKVNKIDFEEVKIELAKGQHRTPEFKEINPTGRVPAIVVDGKFKLSESHAILIFLASAFPGVADHWYPSDIYKRAEVQSILDWHHSNLRRGSKINPMGQVPAIVIDGKFKLAESHAILTFLASAFPGVSDHWYPSDIYMRYEG